jgi:serine/threonine protein kinase
MERMNKAYKYLTLKERLNLVKDIQNGVYLVKDSQGQIQKKVNSTLFTERCRVLDILEKLADIKEIGAGSYGVAHLVCSPKGNCLNGDNKYVLSYSIKEVKYQNLGTYNILLENPDRYENAEIRMLQFLSALVFSKATPHINLPIMSFICQPSPHLSDRQDVELSPKRYIVSELADYGNMYSFINSKFKQWRNNPNVWKVLFFQILSTLSIIHKYYPNFLHNDFKPDNLLVRSTQNNPNSLNGGYFKYIVNGITYYLPDVGFQVLLWDFDFSCIAGVIDNDKLIVMIDEEDANLTCHRNQYYDIHMCFGFLNRLWGDSMPDETVEWLNEYLLTDQILSSESDERILESIEYTTPTALLDNDFFDQFRYTPSSTVKIIDSYTGELDMNMKFDFGDKKNRYTDPKTCKYQSYVLFDPKHPTQDELISLRNRYKCKLASESSNLIKRVSGKQYSKMSDWMDDIFSTYDIESSISEEESKNIRETALKLFQKFIAKYYVTSEYLYAILCVSIMYASFQHILTYITPFNNFSYWYSLGKLSHLKPGSLEDTYKQFCGFVAKNIEGC